MNYLPWFFLIPHGLSGGLKRRGGYKPFNEILTKGVLGPGQAVMTSGGRLNQKSFMLLVLLCIGLAI